MLARAPRSIAHNSLAQVFGRLLLSFARLGVAMLIVRLFGRDTFGQYALLLGFVAIFEWLADFGQTDIAVRDVCANPARAGGTLATLTRLKRVMAPVLVLLLPGAVLLGGYDRVMVWAAFAAGPGIAAYALLQIGRARLRAGMRQDLDIAAELVGVAVLLAGTLAAASAHLPIVELALVYTMSRLVHAALVFWWSGGGIMAASTGEPALALARGAAPIGVAGLAVALYEGMAPIMLASLTTFSEVAGYAAAARFAVPVLTIMQALGSVFLPILASARNDPTRLAETQSTVVWLTLLIAGGLASGLAGGSAFLLDLFGGTMREDVSVLQGMCWLVFARAFTQAMSPLIMIGGAQGIGLILTMTALVAQAIAIPLLVPIYGVFGVVAGYLAIECVFGIVPVSVLGLRATGIGFDWRGALPLVFAGIVTLALVPTLPFSGSFGSGVLAGAMFLALAVAFGGVTPLRLRRVAAALRKPGVIA